jgi:tripartite ATP-independent transporter DctM subunit
LVELSPEIITIIMFGGLLLGILLGYPLAVVIGGVGMFAGFMFLGPMVFKMFPLRVLGFMSDYILLAVPLFIFMGTMMEASGTAEKLYGALYLWLGGLRGGLAIATILMGTILAACVGIIAASTIMMGLIALPSMIQRGYSRDVATGSVCAGGTLGILIPPSVMLVIYGPMSSLSVGKLMMGAFMPGLLLSTLYISYIGIRCLIRREDGPPMPMEERAVPFGKKIAILLSGLIPPVFIILAVLGSIFFGIAAPTEAAALGALASVVLAASYRRLNMEVLTSSMLQTLRITCMAFLIGWGATMFTGTFLRVGGGEVVTDLVLAMPGGKWGAFGVIMFIIFILGMFIDWLGILFIMVPIVTPIGDVLGFDPIWFALMICVNLQMSFMTPPFAYAIFFVKGISKPEWGVTTAHIIKGVIPFVFLIVIGLVLCTVFPQIILWLPGMMIK